MLLQNKRFLQQPIIFLYFFSILVSNSPQLFLEHSQQIPKFQFLLSILDFSSILSLFLTFLNLGFLVWIGSRLIYLKQYSIAIQIWRYLFGPIMVYIGLKELQYSVGQEFQSGKIITVINTSVTLILLLVISIKLSVPPRTQNVRGISCISPHYHIATTLYFIVLSTFCLTGLNYRIGLTLLFCLNILKSTIVVKKLNYEKVIFQYCSILNEITAWISFMVLGLKLDWNVNANCVLWVNSLGIMGLMVRNSRHLMIFIQDKYLSSVRKVKHNAQLNKTQTSLITQTDLIQVLICIFHQIEQIQGNQNAFKIKFSKTLSSQINQLIQFLSQNIAIRHSIGQILNFSDIWQIISNLPQIKHESYARLRRFLIDNCKIYTDSMKYKLLKLYYMNRSEGMLQDIIYRNLTRDLFMGYRSSIKNEGFVEVMRRDKNNSTQTQMKYNKSLDYCLSNPTPRSLANFDLYYTQSLVQDKIHVLFHQTFQTESTLQTFISKPQKKHGLFPIFIQRSSLKTKLLQKIDSLSTLNILKSFLYRFMFEYYVDNTPSIAISRLKKSSFENLLVQKIKLEEKTCKKISQSMVSVNYNYLNKLAMAEDTMVCIVSGCQKFGSIYNSCQNFKAKMEIRTETNQTLSKTNLDNLSIYDIMLPIWIQPHSRLTKNSNCFDNPPCHRGSKFHILSLIEKKTFQVNFEMHYITRNTEDLLLGLQIKAKPIEKICIYRKDEKIFQNIGKKMQSPKGTKAKMTYKKITMDETAFIQQDFNRTQEVIFGQKYTIYKVYKQTDDSISIKGSNRARHEPSLEASQFSVNPEKNSTPSNLTSRSQISQINRQNESNMQKLEAEIKLVDYSRNTFFFFSNFMNFTSIHWQIPPIILLMCMFLRKWAIQQQALNLNLFETKINLYKDFLLVDTHLLNSLYYLDQLNKNLRHNDFVRDTIVEVLIQDIKLNTKIIHKRQFYVTDVLIKNSELIDFAFHRPESNNQAQSFFYSSLRYDVEAEDYLKLIGFTEGFQDQIQQILNFLDSDINNLNIKRFFNRFKHRYEEYFLKDQYNAVITRLSQYEIASYQSSKKFFNFALNFILVVNLFPAMIFVFIYIDLRFKVQKLIFECMNFGQSQIKKIKSKIAQAEEILYNCRQRYPFKVMNKYKKSNEFSSDYVFPYDSKTDAFKINVGNKQITSKRKIYDSKVQLLSQLIPQFLTFLLVIVFLQIFLICQISEITSEIELIQSYTTSTQKIGYVCSLSNQISTEILYEINDKSRGEYLIKKMDEYWKMEKISVLRDIELNQKKYELLAFSKMCDFNFNDNNSICQNNKNRIKLSYAQSISANIKQFKSIKNHFQSLQTVVLEQIDYHINKINNRLSILNRFVQKILSLGLINYQNSKKTPETYFNFIIIEMMMVIVLFNWFSYCQLYQKFKVYYQEVFSCMSVEDMEKYEVFAYYLNRSKEIGISDIGQKIQQIQLNRA